MERHVKTRSAALALAALILSSTAGAGPRESRIGREVTLPTGTVLPLTLDTSVGSDSSRVEDAVHAHLRRPLVVDGLEVLPRGTRLSGVVTDVERSARVKGRGRLALRFTTLAHDRERYRVQTSRVVREAPGTKKKDATTIAVPAGAGALIGALTKGKKGAAVGGAIGGAAGTGVVLATRGRDVRLARGTAVGVRLLQPLRIAIERER